MGSLGEWVEYVYKRKIGHEKWKQHRKVTEELWQRIRREIANLDLDYQKVRLYQDGLPNSGTEERIVRELAEKGSENHRLLAEFMDKGAKVTGTEPPELLLEEYETIRGMLSSHSHEDVAGLYAERRRALLLERDRYIAQRISDTLATGETGLIFLGMLHSVEDHLSPHIRLSALGGTRPILVQAGIASPGEAARPEDPGEVLPPQEAV